MKTAQHMLHDVHCMAVLCAAVRAAHFQCENRGGNEDTASCTNHTRGADVEADHLRRMGAFPTEEQTVLLYLHAYRATARSVDKQLHERTARQACPRWRTKPNNIHDLK